MGSPSLLPRYFRNHFWQFLSDPDETPRAKLFFDNFRNYAVAAAFLVAGDALMKNIRLATMSIPGIVLTVAGWVMAIFSGLQLFALSIRAFHQYIDFRTLDHWLVGALKMYALMFTPGLLLWAMWSFVRFASHRIP